MASLLDQRDWLTKPITTTTNNIQYQWKCQIHNVGSLTLVPTNELLEQVLYQFSSKISDLLKFLRNNETSL